MKKLISILVLACAFVALGAQVPPTSALGRSLIRASTAAQMRTNLQLNSTYGFDEDCLTYCNSHGVTNLADMACLDGFFRTLKAGGVYSDLVDFYLCQTNYNAPTLASSTTWAGRIPNIKGTSPTYDGTGIRFAHAGNSAIWMTNFPDMRTNTTFVQAQLDAANWATAGGTFVMQNGTTAGSFGAGESYIGLGVLQNGNSGVQWRQGNGTSYSWATYADHHRLNGLGINGTRVSDYPRLYVSAVSNLTWKAWLENIPAGVGNGTPVLADAVNAMTTPLTNIFIGGIITASDTFTSWGQCVKGWLVLDVSCDQSRVDCVNKAFRCLNRSKKNVVFYGDSRLAGESFDFAGAVGDQRDAFPNRLMGQLGNSDAYWVNMSVPSINLNQQADGANLGPRVLFYAPDGKTVTETEVYFFASAYNHFANVGGSTVLTTFNQASNVCAQMKAAGLKVNLITEAPIATINYATNSLGGSWTNFALQYNVLLATNTGLADRLIRYDLAFVDSERVTNANYYTDGIHPSAGGNRRLANFVARQIGGQLGGLENIRSGTTNLTAQSAITLSFRVPFPGTAYTVTATGSAALAGVFVSAKTTTSCVLNMTAFTGTVDWLATYQTQ